MPIEFLELTHKLFWNILLTELIQRVAALPLSFCFALPLEKGILVRVCEKK
jgi:hypothetical protein